VHERDGANSEEGGSEEGKLGSTRHDGLGRSREGVCKSVLCSWGLDVMLERTLSMGDPAYIRGGGLVELGRSSMLKLSYFLPRKTARRLKLWFGCWLSPSITTSLNLT